jgi:hyperosmotically inducible periplasmic protein
MKSFEPSHRGRGIFSAIVGLLVVLLIIGGLAYYFRNRGTPIKQAFYSVKETSEDLATTSKVKTALALSKHLSAFDIDVSTEKGEVTLTGQVPSQETKSLAGAIVQDTSGVRQVHNNLSVNPAVQRNPEAERLGERVADLEVKTLVTDALLKSPDLKDKRIEVAVKNRVVNLSGTVETLAQKYAAEQIARGVDGVQAVTNHLTATSSQATSESADDKLSKRVEFELYSTKAVSLTGVQIQSHNGTVTLTGSVPSQAEKLLAEKVAQTVEGVRKVVNDLTVAERIEK